MRHLQSIVGILALALGTACGPSIHVNVLASPEANFAGLHTFRILQVPQRRRGNPNVPNDPMLVNSISYRALRQALRSEFEKRGYTVAEEQPDFTVAYYAAAREKLDVTVWDYGYGWRPRWGPGRVASVDTYTQGTVIVDVVDPATHELLWRGRGVSAVSDDPDQYAKDLQEAAAAIVAHFPAAH